MSTDLRPIDTLARALGAQVLETHISWVLLAGDDAYKIKKPLALPFVDYSTLERRRHCCEEEVRINQRFAPTLYRGVLRVTGTPQAPRLGGDGPVLEYAVQMRRFPADALWSQRLAEGRLGEEQVDALAAWLHARHAEAPCAGLDTPQIAPPQRRQSAQAALEGAGRHADPRDVAALRSWLGAEALVLQPLWQERLQAGRVRECHGDLHLDNLLWLDGGPAAFDAIEFDPALRWIDVLDDAAFVMMDLEAHGRRDLAFRFLNAWLDLSGDHKAMPALRFAVVARALVRAHVHALRNDAARARSYLGLARAWTRRQAPRLFVMHGLPGSGKSYTSQVLLQQHGALRLRSDVERLRLFGVRSVEAGLDLYGATAKRLTYTRLLDLARIALRAGHSVVLDAAFTRRDERQRALGLARELHLQPTLVDCAAPMDVLRARVQARHGDASQADVAVLERMAQALEPLTDAERLLAQPAEALVPAAPPAAPGA